MEDSQECLNTKIENSDNNNTKNLSLGDEDSLKKELFKKDEKIRNLEKDIENLLKESDRNQHLTFVHKILKKQKEEAVEKSERLSSCLHQQEIDILSLERRLGELTAQLEKNKEEALNLPAKRNDEGAEDIRKLLEDATKENAELKAKNESLEKELAVFNDRKKMVYIYTT